MACLLVFIDACNEEYINQELTPFLNHLKSKGSYARLTGTPSFAESVELFTGNSPTTTDTFVDFCFNAGNSVFKLLRFVRLPTRLRERKDTRQRIRNFLVSRIYYLLAGNWAYFPENIPLSLLAYLSLNESQIKYVKSERERSESHLFGILERSGLSIKLVSGNAEAIVQKVNSPPIGKSHVLFLYYGDLDNAGHENGPRSVEINNSLKKIDASIEELYNALAGEIDFIAIYTDHNMEEVTEEIDLWHELKTLDARIPEDYIVFLNSPMGRFWFRNDRAREEVKALLKSLRQYGRQITKDELREQGLPTDEKYGEVIFWLKKGVNIYPDFYHATRLKGMHGYMNDQAKIPLVIFHKGRELKLRSEGRLIDVMPTILDLLNIRPNIKIDGKSLIAKG